MLNQPDTPDTPADKPTRAEISRRNGAKSHGPVTPQGKAISSRNATKHGLLARTIVLPSESRKRFSRLLNSIRAEIQPTTPIERHLVECMAVARWRKMRLWGFEQAVIRHEVSQRAPANPAIAAENDNTQAAVSISQFADQSRFLTLLSTSEARYERQFDRAHQRIMNLRAQAERAALLAADPADSN